MGEPGALAWGVRGYLLLAWTWIRVAMAYRTSFAILFLGSLAVTGLDFVAIAILFSTIDALGGFTLPEVAFLYGGSALALGLADLSIGNVERLGRRIRSGSFDVMLIRPVPVYAQLCADEFAPRRLARVLQGSVVLGTSITLLDIDWSPGKVLAVAQIAVFGTGIFIALFTLGASFQFVTTDGSEAANAFTYGGSTLAQYPLTIFPTELVRGLTFVVPIAFVNWYPSLYVLDRADPLGLPGWVQLASPLATLVVGALAWVAWRTGVRRYRSTGS